MGRCSAALFAAPLINPIKGGKPFQSKISQHNGSFCVSWLKVEVMSCVSSRTINPLGDAVCNSFPSIWFPNPPIGVSFRPVFVNDCDSMSLEFPLLLSSHGTKGPLLSIWMQYFFLPGWKCNSEVWKTYSGQFTVSCLCFYQGTFQLIVSIYWANWTVVAVCLLLFKLNGSVITFIHTLKAWLTDPRQFYNQLLFQFFFPSTAAAWNVWPLSLVTSALSRLSVCLPVCPLCPSRSTTRPMWSPAPKSLSPLLLWYTVRLHCCLHACMSVCLRPNCLPLRTFSEVWPLLSSLESTLLSVSLNGDHFSSVAEKLNNLCL